MLDANSGLLENDFVNIIAPVKIVELPAAIRIIKRQRNSTCRRNVPFKLKVSWRDEMSFLPAMRSSYPGLMPAEIDSSEMKLGSSLQEDVKAFYLEHNGGRLLGRHVVKVPEWKETVVNCIFSLNDDGEINALTEYKDYRSMDRIPKNSFPFADDPGGNLFIVSLERETFGSVYLWNHEEENSDGGIFLGEFQNMYRIAGGVSELFGMLV